VNRCSASGTNQNTHGNCAPSQQSMEIYPSKSLKMNEFDIVSLPEGAGWQSYRSLSDLVGSSLPCSAFRLPIRDASVCSSHANFFDEHCAKLWHRSELHTKGNCVYLFHWLACIAEPPRVVEVDENHAWGDHMKAAEKGNLVGDETYSMFNLSLTST
jgi:hypothetical protein